jgi:polyisoprenoid-binding protein YceI
MSRWLSVWLLVAALPAHAATITYLVESRHTQGVVRWNHMGFSHPTAQFTRVEGALVFDPADPTRSSVRVTIPMTALGTGVPDLDDDFRSPAFFDFARFPVATFTSRKIEKGGHANHYRVTGELALHGVTRPVVLDATLNRIGTNLRDGVPAIGFEATTRLKRSEFGVGRFVPVVSDEVDIDITFEANEARALIAYLRHQAATATTDADRKDFAQAAAEAEAQAMAVGKHD